jgi:hypothetical protein
MYREAVINAVPRLVAIREKLKTQCLIATAKKNSSEAARHSRYVNLGMIQAQLSLLRGGLAVLLLEAGIAAHPRVLATEDMKTVNARKQRR